LDSAVLPFTIFIVNDEHVISKNSPEWNVVKINFTDLTFFPEINAEIRHWICSFEVAKIAYFSDLSKLPTRMPDDVFHINDAALKELFGSIYDLNNEKQETAAESTPVKQVAHNADVKIWHCFEGKKELNNSEREFVRKVQQAIHISDQLTRAHFGDYRSEELQANLRDTNAEFVFFWSDRTDVFPGAEAYSIQIDGDVQCLVLQPLKAVMSNKDEKLKLWNLLKAVSF